MARPGKLITEEQIEIVKATYAETGSYRASSRAAGVSVNTAKKYADNLDEFEQARTEKRIDIIAKITELQIKLIETMMDDAHLKRASFQELATSFGITTDKKLLLTGQATARIETGSIDPGQLTPEEREKAAEIRDKLSRQAARR